VDAGTIRAFVVVFSFALLLGMFFGSLYAVPTGNIAVIPVIGEISGSGSSLLSSTVTSTSIIKLIESAESNPNVEAIILEINSPGGTVVGTKEIVTKVKSVSKPIVAWIREIGASGGYWIASATDSIVADPLSITGSIGVTAAYLSFEGLFHKYGITYENLSVPAMKDMGTQYKNMTDEERAIMEHILNETYYAFVEDVSLNREINVSEVIRLSDQGAILLGLDAYEKGLVDHLGGEEIAVNITAELAGVDYPVIERYGTKVSLLSLFAGLVTPDPNINTDPFELKT
jgi:protease-4